MIQASSRQQSTAEEWANSLSHGLAAVAALGAAAWLLPRAMQASRLAFLGCAVFVSTMIVLYVVSSIYHAARPGPLKSCLLKLDYCAIYVFIAGTYTPFTLGVLFDAGGRWICALIWSLAAIGVVLRSMDRLEHPVLSVGLYLAMGWLVLLTGRAMIERIHPVGIFWLVAGGLAYTIGVVFYASSSRLRFGHFVWHMFVIAGTACHVRAVLESAF